MRSTPNSRWLTLYEQPVQDISKSERKGRIVAQRVVHFEVIGRDGEKLQRFYSGLFGWEVAADNSMHYGTVRPEQAGIGGGIGTGPEDYPGHVTFYVEVPDVEVALARAESLGGRRVMGPDEVMEGLVIGQFLDPEGHLIGLVKSM